MKYQFAALFAEESQLSSIAACIPAAKMCSVSDRWAIIPLPKLFLHGLGAREKGFSFLVSSVAELARNASTSGPITWIEADFDDGIGGQSSIVWNGGAVSEGPFFSGNGVRTPLSLSDWPINRALRLMGVEAVAGRDEYDTLRLGRYRKLEQWLDAELMRPRTRQTEPRAERIPAL